MYAIHNEGESVFAERFIRTLKTAIYKYMTSISKNVYINKLDDIVNAYSYTYRTIKTKLVDVEGNTYVDLMYLPGSNDKDPKFKKNWSEEVFVIKKVKNTVPWTYFINDLNGEEIIGIFYEKELQKTNQKEFRIEKVIRRKGDKLYVKWKGYDSSFNSWIDKKGLIK